MIVPDQEGSLVTVCLNAQNEVNLLIKDLCGDGKNAQSYQKNPTWCYEFFEKSTGITVHVNNINFSIPISRIYLRKGSKHPKHDIFCFVTSLNIYFSPCPRKTIFKITIHEYHYKE